MSEVDKNLKRVNFVTQRLIAAQNKYVQMQQNIHKINNEFTNLSQNLMKVQTYEILNRETGIAYDKQGKSMAQLEVQVISAKDIPRMDMFSGKADPYVKLSLVPSSMCQGTSEGRTETKWKTLSPVWNQDFTFSPIVSKSGTILLRIMDAEKFGDDDLIAQTEIPMTDLTNQRDVDRWYPLLNPEGKSGAGSLRVRCKLFLSNILPMEHAMSVLHTKKEECQQDLTATEQLIVQLEEELKSEKMKTNLLGTISEGEKTFMHRLSDFLHGDEDENDPDCLSKILTRTLETMLDDKPASNEQ